MTTKRRKIVGKKAIIQNKNKVVGLTTLGLTLGALSLITLNSQATYKTSNKRSQTNTLNNNLVVSKSLKTTIGKPGPFAKSAGGNIFGGLVTSALEYIFDPSGTRQQAKLLEEIRDEQKRQVKQQEAKREERREPIDRDDYSEKCDEWATTFLYPGEYPPRYCMELWDEESRRRD